METGRSLKVCVSGCLILKSQSNEMQCINITVGRNTKNKMKPKIVSDNYTSKSNTFVCTTRINSILFKMINLRILTFFNQCEIISPVASQLNNFKKNIDSYGGFDENDSHQLICLNPCSPVIWMFRKV